MADGQKHICCAEGKQMQYRPWSHLPVDILNLIIRRLPKIIDQIYFRFVCKNWHLAKVPQYEGNVPWLLGLQWDFDINNGGAMTQLSSFHIPSPNNQFHITKSIVKKEEEFFGAGICASKYGWLLLQKSNKSFFYSPFSRKAIKLPNMEINFNRATFSSSPTSPDCICFVIESSKSIAKIRISICSPGGLEWRTIAVDGFKRAVEDVVYSNGCFYCVFSGGVLGAFYVAGRDWRVLTDMEPIIGIQFWARSQLVESNGELLLVCRSTNFHVFRFDWSEMGWIEIHKLGNQALFLGCTSFAIAAEWKTSALADRIYYHGECHRSYFYYLPTNKKYACEDFYPWVVHDAMERVWIEPPSF
ncbi:F-box protein At3g56470-like [Durio zibethinus]|uniref:F-box protein At3g56470-like n=1 Tax=Durio zibethinus TaxID=66656 RepID=A0A6P5Z1X6_DURZI|nr:F-box protein At3g56470-like [Durio zibethinus]XP_022746566.1 F-box protein At3g56470-like [Durio zibethinus]XP_022746567.1 F-box protein At3g56470-like [Durio zibethinus]XP_022746568.1 F-box protein At3g56470-like [Durio zibethinus]XP_022746569.1 F-box protein At3g56470-like [Durio zibethinus]XP_022746570.1 F-box protein At3g56470-like [Durio zibethinus]